LVPEGRAALLLHRRARLARLAVTVVRPLLERFGVATAAAEVREASLALLLRQAAVQDRAAVPKALLLATVLHRVAARWVVRLAAARAALVALVPFLLPAVAAADLTYRA